jgi:hypothetical protein
MQQLVSQSQEFQQGLCVAADLAYFILTSRMGVVFDLSESNPLT